MWGQFSLRYQPYYDSIYIKKCCLWIQSLYKSWHSTATIKCIMPLKQKKCLWGLSAIYCSWFSSLGVYLDFPFFMSVKLLPVTLLLLFIFLPVLYSSFINSCISSVFISLNQYLVNDWMWMHIFWWKAIRHHILFNFLIQYTFINFCLRYLCETFSSQADLFGSKLSLAFLSEKK